MKTLKINSNSVLVVFMLIFPILPYYFSVLGVSGINLAVILFALLIIAVKHEVLLPSIKITNIGIFLAMWILGQSISLIFHGSFSQLLSLLLTTIGVWIGMYVLIDSKRKFLLAIRALIYTGGIVSIFGIIESLTGFNIFSFLNTTGVTLNYNPKRFGITRIISFTSHAIIFGVFLMFIMSLIIYYLQFCKNNREKVLLRVIYILLWINLFLTLSRSSIICAIISQLLILLFCGMKETIKTILKISIVFVVIVLLAGLVFPQIFNYLTNIWYMLLALFNDNYSMAIASSFGQDNLVGIGNRLDLYKWVFDSMHGNWLLGNGLNKEILFTFTATDGYYFWTNTKSSIEVQYLYTLYFYGLITVIPEIILYFYILIECYKKREKKSWENTIGFNSVMFSAFLSYFLILFAVNRSSETRLLYVLIGLLIIYSLRKDSFGLEEKKNA